MKIAAVIFTCVAVFCGSHANNTSTIIQQAKLFSVTDAVAATPAVKTLPPAYLITPQKVLQTDQYTEGVVFDRKGNLYFSQTKVGTITVLATDGSLKLWAQVKGANGHKIMPDGTHIVAAQNSVIQLDENGKLLKVIAKEFNGKPLQYPNDITLDPQGGFYFTDSGDSNIQQPNGTVYYINAAGKINFVVTGLAYANGLLFTSDRKRLFVSESNKNRILVYDVLSQGKGLCCKNRERW